jgi:DNA-binding response OmpR family regulator
MTTKNKILTISNDQALLQLIEELNDGNYEIASTQQTGLSLREVLGRELPDFIILDIMMPTLDGIGICLKLRQWTQVPIMMLSTWGTSNGMVRGLNLSSDSYLTEPFGVDILREKIHRTLQRKYATLTDH